MNFTDTYHAERAALTQTKWDRWIDEAEKRFGRSLDGDQTEDGYSLDHAFDAFRAGTTPSGYVLLVRNGLT